MGPRDGLGLNPSRRAADNFSSSKGEPSKVKKLVVGAALLTTLAVGCGGSQVSSPAAPAPATTTPPAEVLASPASGIPAAAQAYFDALTVYGSRMLEVSAPGSPAHTYAQVQLGAHAADRASGYSRQPSTNQVEGDTVRSCLQDGGCVTFADFATDSAGLLAGFTINGRPVAERVVPGGQTASAGGLRFKLVGALQLTSANGLNVVMEATNGGQPTTSDSRGLLVSWYDAAYVGPDGRQMTVTQWVGPRDLRPNATAPYGLYFEGAKPGGTVHINGWKDNNPWEVRFKI